jgi:hypothetical protein
MRQRGGDGGLIFSGEGELVEISAAFGIAVHDHI